VYIGKDTLGMTIKNARSALGLTQEQVAERLEISSRYFMQLENSQKKPSCDLLFKIIRGLNIQPDQIFYPENLVDTSNKDMLVRMLYGCNERSLKIIRATVQATLDSQPKE
jgi:transcriptional regulator with XRE-family HTH domain